MVAFAVTPGVRPDSDGLGESEVALFVEAGRAGQLYGPYRANWSRVSRIRAFLLPPTAFVGLGAPCLLCSLTCFIDFNITNTISPLIDRYPLVVPEIDLSAFSTRTANIT